jgi:phage terminase small subunit
MKAELLRPPRAPRLPKAPGHLRPATRRWWNEIVRSWDLGTHHLRLLKLACEALDRAEEARERIAVDGAYLEGRYGLRAHPALAIERDSRLAAARLLRELDLDASSGADSRPPMLRRYD